MRGTVAENPRTAEVEKTFEETVAGIEECVMSNRANALALIECLRLCSEEGPYREIESKLASQPSISLSTQTPHALIGFLIARKGIASTSIDRGVSSEEGCEDEGDLQNVPADYLLKTTEAGLEVLERFDPFRRLDSLIAREPDEYRKLYTKILSFCLQGATLPQINEELGNEPALYSPKRIYPEYFISKLETVGGIAWRGTWSTTQAGKEFLFHVGLEDPADSGGSEGAAHIGLEDPVGDSSSMNDR